MVSRFFSLAVFSLFAVYSPLSAQDERAKSGDFEKHLKNVVELVHGERRNPLPPKPWTEDSLDAYLSAYFKLVGETAALSPEKGGRLTYEHSKLMLAARTAKTRLLIKAENPARADQRDVLAWFDSWIAFHQIKIHELDLAFDWLGRYAAAKSKFGFSLDKRQEAELTEALAELEHAVRLRLITLRALFLLYPPASFGMSPDKLREHLDETIRLLPQEHRAKDLKRLNACVDEQDRKISATINRLLYHKVYNDLLKREKNRAFDRLEKLKDGGSSPERREIEKQYSRANAEQMRNANVVYQWRVKNIHLSLLQERIGQSAGDKTRQMPPIVKLPPDHESMGKSLEKTGQQTIERMRLDLNIVEKVLEEQKKLPLNVRIREWMEIRGKEVVAGALDALLDDMTEWMDSIPATRQRVKAEILFSIGVTQFQNRLKDLPKDQREKIEQYQRRSLKDIVLDFDRNTIDRIREDLTILEHLVKEYPTNDLVLVSKPSWSDEPKSRRVSLKDCTGLNNNEAARAYLRLFEQLDEDYADYFIERSRLLIGLELKIVAHLRAGAKN